MRARVLATDYDGTLATAGHVADTTTAALDRLRAAGGLVVLVTGRRLDDLRRVCPVLDRFARVVAEDGAVLFDPKADRPRVLCAPPDAAFVQHLRARGVRVDTGQAIVATDASFARDVHEAIRALGLPLHVSRNKGALMVLPEGVDKRSGLVAALGELGIAREGDRFAEVVGIGDAENDAAFLAACGTAVAVANALEALKRRADRVTRGAEGAGVVELIGEMFEL